MNTIQLTQMIHLAQATNIDNARFRQLALMFLTDVKRRLQIQADIQFIEYEKKSILPGDALLHGDDIYIRFGGGPVYDYILYRKCRNRKDHEGFNNNRFYFDMLHRYGIIGFTRAVQKLRLEANE